MPYKDIEKRREYHRRRYQANKQLYADRWAEWKRVNPERWAEYCKRKYNEWKLNNPERYQRKKAYHQKHHLELKRRVLTHYGNGLCACVACGYNNDIRALSIDHINNGGHLHRKRVGNSGAGFYRWLEVSHYPLGYQTLCMNCQWIKEIERRNNSPLHID